MTRFLTTAGTLIDRIKVNSMARATRAGKPLWVKRRHRFSVFTLIGANAFFRVARNPVSAIWDLQAWQRWECESFNRLHADRFRAFADGPRGVAADALPGVNLTLHLDGGTLTAQMLAAAASELRRAHGLACAELRGGWSHGDSHAGNFIYDAAENCARLIDFDVMHDPQLSAPERHADDVLVFLQDMLGRISRELWLPSALAFLAAYGDADVTRRMREKLFLPRGIPWIWWMIRTGYLPREEIAQRLAELRARI